MNRRARTFSAAALAQIKLPELDRELIHSTCQAIRLAGDGVYWTSNELALLEQLEAAIPTWVPEWHSALGTVLRQRGGAARFRQMAHDEIKKIVPGVEANQVSPDRFYETNNLVSAKSVLDMLLQAGPLKSEWRIWAAAELELSLMQQIHLRRSRASLYSELVRRQGDDTAEHQRSLVLELANKARKGEHPFKRPVKPRDLATEIHKTGLVKKGEGKDAVPLLRPAIAVYLRENEKAGHDFGRKKRK